MTAYFRLFFNSCSSNDFGLAARLIGKEDMANRLFSSLQVDNSKACDLFGWKPGITMDEQLKKIADAT